MRRVLLLVGVAVAIAGAVYWYPVVRDHLRVLTWQRRCLNYQPPADHVVFDDSNNRVTPRVQGDWSNLYSRLSPPGLRSEGTLFVGAMTDADGQLLLVAVDMGRDAILVGGSVIRQDVLVTARVVEPGSLVERPRLRSTTATQVRVQGLLGPVGPAERDPKDLTHLILLDDRVDAWLNRDGRVTLAVRP